MTCNIAQNRSLQYLQLFNQRQNSREYSLLPQLRAYFAFPICCNWSSFFKRSQLLLPPFFEVKYNVPSALIQKTYSRKQSFLRNLPKRYNIDGKQFNNISRHKTCRMLACFCHTLYLNGRHTLNEILKCSYHCFPAKF